MSASAAESPAFHASPSPERRTRSRAETIRAMVGDAQSEPSGEEAPCERRGGASDERREAFSRVYVGSDGRLLMIPDIAVRLDTTDMGIPDW